MAAADMSEKWTVVIDCDDEDKGRMFKLPNTTKMEEVKARWCGSVGASPDSVVLMTMDGTRVQSESSLLEVGESFPGRKNINLAAETVVSVLVELYKQDSFRVRMQARLSAPPEDLEEAIRVEFGIPSERHLRLRSAWEALSPGVGVGAQGVEEGSLLQVELLYDVSVTEAWSGGVEQFVVFGSEPCSLLVQEDAGVPQRLASGKCVLDTALDVVDALRPLGGLAQPSYSVRLDLLREFVVAVGRALRERRAWPSDRAASVIPWWARAPVQAGLMFDSAPVPWSARLSSVDLPASALLHCAPMSVRVRTSDRKVHAVRVPRLGAVADVKACVRAQEEATHFELRCRGRTLEEEESLSGAGVSPGDLLEVEPTGLSLRVTLSDRAMRWHTHRKTFRFSELMEEVSRFGSVVYEELLDRTLCCVGCGRRVCLSEEAFQAVPAPCCRVRSLDLAEPTSRECGTQTCTAARRRARGVERSVATASRGAQAVAFWHQAGTQTEGASRAGASTGVQTGCERRRRGQQHTPPAPRPFRIYGFGGRRNCDLLLHDRPTVGEVRAAVAQELGKEPGGVKLGRQVARREGREVFVVCNERGEVARGSWEDEDYGDDAGGVWRGRSVKDHRWRILDDDGEYFPLAPRRRNYISAFLR